MEKAKIELYQVRSFGDKLNATFGFLSENAKVVLKYLTYFLLPLSLVQAVAMSGYFSSITALGEARFDQTNDSLVKMVVSLGVTMLLYCIGTLLLVIVLYALMRLYRDREERLQNLTWVELRPMFVTLLVRCLKLLVFSFVVSVAVGLLMFMLIGIYPALVFLLWLVLVVVGIPLALVYPVYMFEDDISFFGAVAKALRLGFATWRGILGVLFVLGFLAAFVSGMVSLPWSVLATMKVLLGAGEVENAFVNSVGFGFLTYLAGVIQAFVGYLTYSLPILGLAYQYGHASEKVDHVTVESDIDRFEEL